MTILAVAQYEIERLPNWESYEDKIVRLAEQAKENQADILFMSEYAGLELASWTENKLDSQFAYIQSLLPDYQELYASLANQYQMYIQPGTLPVLAEDGYYRNRGYFFSPNGKMCYQDKIHLTPFEQQTQLIHSGQDLHVFDTAFGKIGMTICYDCEFPAIAHQLAKAGAQLLLVPSCTEKISGLTRVSISSQARAIENQCFVAQSCLIGKVTWCDVIDINTGQSAVYCPADLGFPEEGILVQSPLNTPIMIYANLNLNQLDHVRQHGEMRNFQDMQTDLSPLLHSLKTVNMT